jgi:hypothetical protein
MFCPKCGGESFEAQRFCKACGTNLQLINNALGGSDDPHGPTPFGINVDALAKNARDFAESFRASWSGAHLKVGGSEAHGSHRDQQRISREIKRQAREEARRQNLPRPKEYMSYSWQHNLRNGLMSLFWGGGLGIFLYYFAQNAIDSGLIAKIEESSHGHVQGLEPIVRMMWMIAFLPALKGLSQIIYASFFGESLATLTARFTPPPALEEPKPFLRQDTAPVVEREVVPRNYEGSNDPPPSVTEHTTHFFDETQPQMKREAQ